tara:strand:- start:374 stop:688 length:315 start_codon:yes stop_codon:yes gene_type:complete
MIETITKTRFIDWFRNSPTRKNQFSYFALDSLFDYLEEEEDNCRAAGQNVFDPIAICCEYTEYSNLAEFKKDYNHEEITDLETLRNFTTVIEIPNRDSFIIQNF